jgi:hypothetical protein
LNEENKMDPQREHHHLTPRLDLDIHHIVFYRYSLHTDLLTIAPGFVIVERLENDTKYLEMIALGYSHNILQ